MITIAQLIEQLKEKDQAEEVEAVVATAKGQIIVAYVQAQAKPMIKMLKLFGSA